jgi:hypothetical protein
VLVQREESVNIPHACDLLLCDQITLCCFHTMGSFLIMYIVGFVSYFGISLCMTLFPLYQEIHSFK